jgi:hypothetical protein
MGYVQGLEKVNNTYMKTVHVGTMNRGFTVLVTVSFFTLANLILKTFFKSSFQIIWE